MACEIKIGDKVVNEYGRIGEVRSSTFGYKVVGNHEYDNTYWKTVGMSYAELTKYWRKCEC